MLQRRYLMRGDSHQHTAFLAWALQLRIRAISDKAILTATGLKQAAVDNQEAGNCSRFPFCLEICFPGHLAGPAGHERGLLETARTESWLLLASVVVNPISDNIRPTALPSIRGSSK